MDQSVTFRKRVYTEMSSAIYSGNASDIYSRLRIQSVQPAFCPSLSKQLVRCWHLTTFLTTLKFNKKYERKSELPFLKFYT